MSSHSELHVPMFADGRAMLDHEQGIVIFPSAALLCRQSRSCCCTLVDCDVSLAGLAEVACVGRKRHRHRELKRYRSVAIQLCQLPPQGECLMSVGELHHGGEPLGTSLLEVLEEPGNCQLAFVQNKLVDIIESTVFTANGPPRRQHCAYRNLLK